MIARTYILKNLKIIERLYADSKSQHETLMYSKLAILELCGWIEESMDSIINVTLLKKLREERNKDYLRKQVIKRQKGFDYEDNFRRTLIGAIGLIRLEKLERKINQPKFTKMTAALDALKTRRDDEAHTYLKITRTLDAPSVTRSRFQDVYDGLKSIETLLKRMKI